MIKKYSYILVISLLFVCTSCFEIIEEVNLKADGSGHVNLTLNLSRSKTKINSLRLLDSINRYKIPSETEFKEEFLEMVNQVKATAGILDVRYAMNFDDYIFSLSCDFADVDALNKVIINFSPKTEAKKILAQKPFNYNKNSKIFSRDYHYDIDRELKKVKMEDREVLENASMTTIYRFETPIKSAANEQAKISGTRKAIMLKVSAKELINHKNSIKNQITLQ